MTSLERFSWGPDDVIVLDDVALDETFESKHPRGDGGKFTGTISGSGAAKHASSVRAAIESTSHANLVGGVTINDSGVPRTHAPNVGNVAHQSDRITIDPRGVGRGELAAAVRHEVGHVVWNKALTDAQRQDWVNAGRQITLSAAHSKNPREWYIKQVAESSASPGQRSGNYEKDRLAGETRKAGEYFAEMYAWYHGSDADKAFLRSSYPRRYAAIDALVGSRKQRELALDEEFEAKHPRGEHGKFERTGDKPDEASRKDAEEKFHEYKRQWAKINNELLDDVATPFAPEVQAKMDELKGLVKQMYGLDADPGGLEGIGLPGGPRDMVVIGAGPGGLAAGVMGGTEGLDTLVIEANPAPGGQAKFSSRIENYPGFPIGATGEMIAKNMYDQAERVGAETKLGVSVTGLTYDPETGMKTLTLSNGETVESRAVIIAGGVQFRSMTFPGSESDRVIVGDGKALTKAAAGGTAVVIGGSNGAAQAALGAAKAAKDVYILSRSPIDKDMSDYQVEALRDNPKVHIIERDEIAAFDAGKGEVTLKSGRTIPATAVGEFVGGAPNTSWLPKELQRDARGAIMTNDSLETNMPGVFAVGDVRHNAIGRIGVAVGDGQYAVKNVWGYFKRVKEAQTPGH